MAHAYEYCERTSDSIFGEPLNTLSNLAFAVAAVVLFVQLRRWFGGRVPAPLLVLVVLLAAISVGSFVFHAVRGWTEYLDTIPIALLILAFFVAVAHYFFGIRWVFAAGVVPAFLLVAGAFSTVVGFVAMYVCGVGMLVLYAALMVFRPPLRPYGYQLLGVSVLFGVSLTARQLDLVLCNGFPIGTHFVWHVLNAAVLYAGIRVLAERVATLTGPAPRGSA